MMGVAGLLSGAVQRFGAVCGFMVLTIMQTSVVLCACLTKTET